VNVRRGGLGVNGFRSAAAEGFYENNFMRE